MTCHTSARDLPVQWLGTGPLHTPQGSDSEFTAPSLSTIVELLCPNRTSAVEHIKHGTCENFYYTEDKQSWRVFALPELLLAAAERMKTILWWAFSGTKCSYLLYHKELFLFGRVMIFFSFLCNGWHRFHTNVHFLLNSYDNDTNNSHHHNPAAFWFQ